MTFIDDNANTQVLLAKAMELSNEGQIKEAIDMYLRVIQTDDQLSIPHYNLGLIYNYQGDRKLCYSHNKKAVE